MPPGTPFDSFVLPYRIRVDNFTSNTRDNSPALHLLTHTHSDHIVGLSAQSFGYKVICSRDAKEMLLRHEVYAERELHDQDYRVQRIRTFAHLKVDPTLGPDGTVSYSGSRDLLVGFLMLFMISSDHACAFISSGNASSTHAHEVRTFEWRVCDNHFAWCKSLPWSCDVSVRLVDGRMNLSFPSGFWSKVLKAQYFTRETLERNRGFWKAWHGTLIFNLILLPRRRIAVVERLPEH